MDNKLWIDTRLTEEEMDFLRHAISEENKEDFSISNRLAGNISKSESIIDKDNWFFKSALKKLTERMFYRDWDNYYKYVVEKEEPLPKFELNSIWVNYMKQHEFNPPHDHTGLYSFVIFMKIPTHWKEQHALPFSANSNEPVASDFAFMYSKSNMRYICMTHNFQLSSEDEGRMLFFPARLKHQVHPFYECEEERVTISGNIDIVLNKPIVVEVDLNVYEEKEKMIKVMENSLRVTKEELKMMKVKGGNI